MQDRPDRPSSPALTRRRFVTMVAAGSAAVLASPLAAVAATRASRPRPHAVGPGTPPVPGGMTAADRTELERQRKSTLDTLAVLRKHAMGPGTEMASVFRVVRPARRNG